MIKVSIIIDDRVTEAIGIVLYCEIVLTLAMEMLIKTQFFYPGCTDCAINQNLFLG